MRNLIRLTDYNLDEITEIFHIADEISIPLFQWSMQ